MKKLLLTISIAFSSFALLAQELQFGYFQMNHRYLLNPSEVVHDPSQLFLEYGRKWSDLAFPPEAFQLGGVYHSSKNLSFGGIINKSSSGILDNYHFGISTGYLVNLTSNQTLSAGINTYLKNSNIVLENVVADLSDPVLTSGDYNKTQFGLGIGLSYSIDHLNIFFGLPETQYIGDYDFASMVNGGAYYDFLLDDFTVVPAINYFGTPTDKVVEGMVMVDWKNTLRLGPGYRSDNTFAVRFEFLSESIALGYAVASNNGGYEGTGISNNFSVRYLFNRDRVKTSDKISALEATNERILSQMDAQQQANDQSQQIILGKLDALTNQQDEVQDLQRNFLQKFEESERKNTVDEATNQELESGYYLVIYSFHDSTELNKIKEELVSLPFESRLIHDKQKSYYYITTKRYDTLEMAVIAMENVRNQGFEEAWIHWYK